jgi:hypothetical protein
VAPWLAVVAVVAAAVLLRQTLPFNVDVSWWLIVSERMLDGQRLYVDILETNPPMALASALIALVFVVHDCSAAGRPLEYGWELAAGRRGRY